MIKNLGKKLKLARINNDLTRAQVSESIGVSVSMIGLYETSERTPSLDVLIKLATIYKVSVDYLLGVNPPTNENTLPLDGLNSEQIKVLKQTAELFKGTGKE